MKDYIVVVCCFSSEGSRLEDLLLFYSCNTGRVLLCAVNRHTRGTVLLCSSIVTVICEHYKEIADKAYAIKVSKYD